jgi:phage baseplate assembly protein W
MPIVVKEEASVSGAASAPTQIPKLRVPLEMGESGFRTVEQDSLEEIAQCAYAILATPVGSLLEEPELGVEDPTFEPVPVDDTEWLEALARWEPRAQVTTMQEIVDLVDNVAVEVGAK